jgi:hypothetical protein
VDGKNAGYSQRWPASEGILTEGSRLSLEKKDGRDLNQYLFLFERLEELFRGRWSCQISGSSSLDESGKFRVQDFARALAALGGKGGTSWQKYALESGKNILERLQSSL